MREKQYNIPDISVASKTAVHKNPILSYPFAHPER